MSRPPAPEPHRHQESRADRPPESPPPRCEVESHCLEIGHQEIRGRHRLQCGQRLEMTVAARTRLNSSHSQISYAVFCLQKKNVRSVETQDPQIPCLNSSHSLILLPIFSLT